MCVCRGVRLSVWKIRIAYVSPRILTYSQLIHITNVKHTLTHSPIAWKGWKSVCTVYYFLTAYIALSYLSPQHHIIKRLNLGVAIFLSLLILGLFNVRSSPIPAILLFEKSCIFLFLYTRAVFAKSLAPPSNRPATMTLCLPLFLLPPLSKCQTLITILMAFVTITTAPL